MIAYEILCQSIEDWRAGRRPTAHIPGPGQAPSAYDQEDSGVVEMDDDEMQVEMEGEADPYGQGYGQDYGQDYGAPAYGVEAGAPGEPMGPTGTPPAYTTEVPPYDAGQPAPYTEMIPTHADGDAEDVDLADDDESR